MVTKLDSLCSPILVYHRRCARQDVGPVFLCSNIQNEWDALGNQNHDGTRLRMDGILPVRYILSGLADPM